MKVSYAGRRQKGRRFERETAELYRKYEIDSTAQPMPMSGAMEHHKGDILKKYDREFVDENKSQESISIWKCWQQAASQAHGLEKPVLHIKRNNTEALSVIRQVDFFDLRAELKQLREQVGIAG